MWVGVMVCITKSNSPHRKPGHYKVLTLRSFCEVHKAKEWSCDELTCYMDACLLPDDGDRFLCFLFKYLDTGLEQPYGLLNTEILPCGWYTAVALNSVTTLACSPDRFCSVLTPPPDPATEERIQKLKSGTQQVTRALLH